MVVLSQALGALASLSLLDSFLTSAAGTRVQHSSSSPGLLARLLLLFPLPPQCFVLLCVALGQLLLLHVMHGREVERTAACRLFATAAAAVCFAAAAPHHIREPEPAAPSSCCCLRCSTVAVGEGSGVSMQGYSRQRGVHAAYRSRGWPPSTDQALTISMHASHPTMTKQHSKTLHCHKTWHSGLHPCVPH